jgi:hypothetical protein
VTKALGQIWNLEEMERLSLEPVTRGLVKTMTDEISVCMCVTAICKV